ncbi:MAG: DinB family protein [Anaerolineales bacterium]|nr:DinB family protein [Anaerolineales bacterium]
MIADQMRRLFSYNTWAWQHVYACVEKLDDTAYHASRSLFQGSIHSLLVHSMSAEQIWFVRCHGESPNTLFNAADFADFAAVRAQWGPIRHGWANYLQWLSDEDCKKFINYRNTKGQPYSVRQLDILQHVVNHATEHRSQLTLVLHEVGFPTEPLDYILFRTRL